MVRWRVTLGAVLTSMALQLPVPARADAGGDRGWQWPLSPPLTVAAPFQAPKQQWGPGHRGIDLLGSVAQPVLAIGAGRVTFAGTVAGRGVVVVDHGRLRSTYEPVIPQVMGGDQVTAGQVIATLAAVRSHCPPAACLHLGVRRGDVYLDPLKLLGSQRVRLKPLSGLDPATENARPIGNGAQRLGNRATPTAARTGPSTVELTVTAGGGAAAGLAASAWVRRGQRRRKSLSSAGSGAV